MEKHKLPEGWEWKRLGDVCKIVSGSTPRTDNPVFWNGDILWATPKDLGQLETIEISDTERKITKAGYESCSTQLLPVGSVLLSSRAPIGHLAINTKPICTNQGFKSLIPGEKIFNRYLYWCLKFYVPLLQHAGRGGTFSEIPKRLVEPFEIPVSPLPEQKRIVAKIEELSSRAEQARKLNQQALEEAENFLPSAVAKVFEEGIAKGWEEFPFGKAVKRLRGRGVKLKTDDYKPDGAIPVVDQGESLIVGYTNREDAISQSQLPVVIFGDHTKNTKYIDFPFAVGADGVVILRPIDSIEPKFFYYWLNHVPLHDLGYSRHYKVLKEQFVQFPSDLNEQRRIVAYLDGLQARVDKLKHLQTEIETDLVTFTPALLAKAFRGEL